MATDNQCKANKENAQSAGVKTEAGKQVVRFNAMKHGLRARCLLSDMKDLAESEEQFLEINQGLRETLRPIDYLEETLVHRAAWALFKMKRCELLEASAFRGLPEIDDLPNFFAADDDKSILRIRDGYHFEMTLKYGSAIEAQFYRALQSLAAHRESKRQLELDLFDKGTSL